MTARLSAGLCAVVLLSASAAQAGPMYTWNFRSVFESVGGADEYAGRVVTLQNIHAKYVSELSGEAGGTKYGWQTVQVGTITPSDGGGDPLADIATAFRLTLWLTDAPSGETGSVSFIGRAGEAAMWVGDPPFQQPTDRRAYVIDLDPFDRQKLTLGGNDYRVRLSNRSHQGDGSTYLDAVVTVNDVAGTPEPGTLALCGVAVAGGVGAWWRRKKR